MPPMEEVELYEALGLTAPEESPEGEPDTGQPDGGAEAQEDEAQDAPQEAAPDGAPEEETQEDSAETPGGGQQPPDGGDDGTQARIDAAVAAARQEEQAAAAQRLKDFFARAGLKNPMDGNKPITTMEEFDAWQRQFEAEQLNRRLKAGQLTQEDLQKLIASSPEMQQIRQQQEAARQKAEAERKAAEKQRIDAELAEIRKLDPAAGSLQDILRMETGKDFAARVRQGYSFLDAFRAANFDRLLNGAANAAKRQETLQRSKQHMQPQGKGKGQGAPSVPADVMRMYKEINPGMTDAEIQKHYARYKAD